MSESYWLRELLFVALLSWLMWLLISRGRQ